MIYLFFLLFISNIIAQLPNCQWTCNDPLCNSECIEVCNPPICITECNPSQPGVCNPVECEIRCPTDQNVLQSCPSCETICQPLRCSPIDRDCQILCEAVICSWQCSLPLICPYPICELSCEQPACEFSSGLILSHSMILFFILFVYI